MERILAGFERSTLDGLSALSVVKVRPRTPGERACTAWSLRLAVIGSRLAVPQGFGAAECSSGFMPCGPTECPPTGGRVGAGAADPVQRGRRSFDHRRSHG